MPANPPVDSGTPFRQGRRMLSAKKTPLRTPPRKPVRLPQSAGPPGGGEEAVRSGCCMTVSNGNQGCIPGAKHDAGEGEGLSYGGVDGRCVGRRTSCVTATRRPQGSGARRGQDADQRRMRAASNCGVPTGISARSAHVSSSRCCTKVRVSTRTVALPPNSAQRCLACS